VFACFIVKLNSS